MRLCAAILAFAVLTISALAQQPPSHERLMQACEAQLDQALKWHRGAAASYGDLLAENAKLRAELDNLKGAPPHK